MGKWQMWSLHLWNLCSSMRPSHHLMHNLHNEFLHCSCDKYSVEAAVLSEHVTGARIWYGKASLKKWLCKLRFKNKSYPAMLDGVILSHQVYSISYSRSLALMDNINLVPLIPGIPFCLASGRYHQETGEKEEGEVRCSYPTVLPSLQVGRGCRLAEAAFLCWRLQLLSYTCSIQERLLYAVLHGSSFLVVRPRMLHLFFFSFGFPQPSCISFLWLP